MPNWCFNRITIYHEDDSKLENLENLIKEWTSKNQKDNGFGKEWLGNIVLASGVGTVDTEPSTDLSCRGRLTYLEQNLGAQSPSSTK